MAFDIGATRSDATSIAEIWRGSGVAKGLVLPMLGGNRKDLMKRERSFALREEASKANAAESGESRQMLRGLSNGGMRLQGAFSCERDSACEWEASVFGGNVKRTKRQIIGMRSSRVAPLRLLRRFASIGQGVTAARKSSEVSRHETGTRADSGFQLKWRGDLLRRRHMCGCRAFMKIRRLSDWKRWAGRYWMEASAAF